MTRLPARRSGTASTKCSIENTENLYPCLKVKEQKKTDSILKHDMAVRKPDKGGAHAIVFTCLDDWERE